MITSRRSFIAGIAAAFAAPAIVRASSLMPVKATLIVPKSSNSLLTIHQITREAVKLFHDSNLFLLDEYSERIMGPMVNQLAENIAEQVMQGRWEKLIYDKERRTIERVIIPLNEVYQS